MQFVFRLDEFQVHRTRSLINDTDIVGLLIRVGDHTIPPFLDSFGDVGDGTHPLHVQIGPIDVPPDATQVLISYSIVNGGSSGQQIKDQIKFVLNAFADAGGQNVPFGLGTLINDFLMFPFHNFEFSGCDGIVVTDSIAMSGQRLAALTSNESSRYAETRRYPGRLDINTPEYKSIYCVHSRVDRERVMRERAEVARGCR